MTIDREMLAAYAEGQLDDAGRARVEAAIAADPSLAEDVAAHHALRQRLQAHFAPVLDMPLPGRLLEAVGNPPPAADVIDLNAVREGATKMRPAFKQRWILGGAIAASLALGLVLGSQIENNDPIGHANGELIARADLDRALTIQAAGRETQPVRILLSLRSGDGHYCRVFETAAMAGLACRNENRWAIERLQSGNTQPGGQYRQAGSALSEIMAAAQAMAPEGAMDREEENTALKRGWK
ncbi:MAG: anti-sigma factor [Sphingobium sp.]